MCDFSKSFAAGMCVLFSVLSVKMDLIFNQRLINFVFMFT